MNFETKSCTLNNCLFYSFASKNVNLIDFSRLKTTNIGTQLGEKNTVGRKKVFTLFEPFLLRGGGVRATLPTSRLRFGTRVNNFANNTDLTLENAQIQGRRSRDSDYARAAPLCRSVRRPAQSDSTGAVDDGPKLFLSRTNDDRPAEWAFAGDVILSSGRTRRAVISREISRD